MNRCDDDVNIMSDPKHNSAFLQLLLVRKKKGKGVREREGRREGRRVEGVSRVLRRVRFVAKL